MSVLDSVQGSVKPGRFDDMLAQAGEVKKLYERLGARNVRAQSAVMAGESSEKWVFSAEFESAEAHGRFLDVVSQDAEMTALLDRIRAADAPTLIEAHNVAVEIPLGRGGIRGPGVVSEVHVSRLMPGRMSDAIEMAAAAIRFVEAHGARNARLWQLTLAGMGAGMYLTTWDFDDLASAGRLTDVWMEEPEGQELAAGVTAANSPTVLVFSGLFLSLPV